MSKLLERNKMRKTNLLLVLCVLTGCNNINLPVQVTKPVPSAKSTTIPEILPTPKVEQQPVVKPETKDIKAQQSGNATEPVPSATPEATPVPSTPTVQPTETNDTSSSPTPLVPQPPFPPDQIEYKIDTNTYTPPFSGIPKPSFSRNDPVSEGIRDANINIFFKDPPMIRYDFNKNVFISKAGADVTNINNIMNEYKQPKVHPFYDAIGKTEEQLTQDEKESEAFFGVDMPNAGSIYDFKVKNTNVKELIEKIRKDPNVLSANENGKGTTA